MDTSRDPKSVVRGQTLLTVIAMGGVTWQHGSPCVKHPAHVMCGCMCAQLCLTLCNPMDCSPQGSSVHGILQARTLEWGAFPLPGDLSNPDMEPTSPVSPVPAGSFFTTEPPGKHPPNKMTPLMRGCPTRKELVQLLHLARPCPTERIHK